MTDTPPVRLAFDSEPRRVHQHFRLLSTSGRHGDHHLMEEAFTWSYTLIPASNSPLHGVTVDAGFRQAAQEIAQAVEDHDQPTPDVVRAIAREVYEAHLAAARWRRNTAKETC